MKNLLTTLLLLSVTCSTIVGCASGVSVDGNVTVDGQPLETGSVSFHPAGSKGEDDSVVGHGNVEKGKYKLYANGQPAIAPGSYKVVVIANAPPDSKDPYALPKSLVDKKYTQLDTTPLTVDVASGNSPEKYSLTLTK